MCGFAGFLGDYERNHAHLGAMADALRHRGPDDAGFWCDGEAQVGLAFRRLSIVDLSSAGHQPMPSASGRYVVVFNGEIYNHMELRSQLEQERRAPRWRGHSDTESLLAAIDAWGIDRAVARTVGMFAFALWDRETRALTIARDRVGEKPLYYGWRSGVFWFASELKALKSHPAFAAELDRDALTLMLRFGNIPAPYCIYQGMRKLLPGSLLTVSFGAQEQQPRRYWDARQVVSAALRDRFDGTPDEAVTALDQKLRAAVQAQMMADVPLGAFLSGGIDSSAIAALMQDLAGLPVKTFSIGFEERGYDEAVYAKQVATHLGTDHTELYVPSAQARDVIPLLPTIYCEPFADSSQIPTFIVSQLARRQVAVSLSGDGGDELFAGYDRYRISSRLWRRISRVPRRFRTTLAHAVRAVPAPAWTLLSLGRRSGKLAHRIDRGAQAISAEDRLDLYRVLVSHWTDPEAVVLNGCEPGTLLTTDESRPQADNAVHEMMAMDLVSYLPDDILVKVDRAAMANSLETRVPFLDHRVIEFAWRLPLTYKLRDGMTKWPLRQLLYRYVPRRLVDRPKMGFGVPIDSWLRGPLRDWAEDLLDESRLRREGVFRVQPIRERWLEHLSGKRDWHYPLWDILMFQAWLANR